MKESDLARRPLNEDPCYMHPSVYYMLRRIASGKAEEFRDIGDASRFMCQEITAGAGYPCRASVADRERYRAS